MTIQASQMTFQASQMTFHFSRGALLPPSESAAAPAGPPDFAFRFLSRFGDICYKANMAHIRLWPCVRVKVLEIIQVAPSSFGSGSTCSPSSGDSGVSAALPGKGLPLNRKIASTTFAASTVRPCQKWFQNALQVNHLGVSFFFKRDL